MFHHDLKKLLGHSLYLRVYRVLECLRRKNNNLKYLFVGVFLIFIIFELFFFTNSNGQEPAGHMKLESIPYKGDYCVIYNYIAHKAFYNDSVTFVTHSDVNGLGQLDVLSKYWDGAISIGILVYPPRQKAFFSGGCSSTKFAMTLSRLDLLSTSMLMGKVSAHLVYPRSSSSQCGQILVDQSLFTRDQDYVMSFFPKDTERYRYPINVLRNVARIGLRSPIFMAAELEEIPSVNFGERVKELALKEFSRNNKVALIYRKFQVAQDEEVPQVKKDLIRLFNAGKAVEFKNHSSTKAYKIPLVQEWMTIPENFNSLSFFQNISYLDPTWEPHFVGYNKSVPMYDDNFIYGLRDQTELVYEMCLEGFEFKVLNDLFTSTMGIQEQMTEKEMEFAKNGAEYEHRMIVEEYTKKLSKQFPDLNERCGIFKADDHFYYHVN